MTRFEAGLFTNSNHLRALTKRSLGNPGSMVHQQMHCCTKYWRDEGAAAFEAELNVLKNPVGASGGDIVDVGVNVPAFSARKEEEVKAIREVSPTSSSSTSVDAKASSIIIYSSMQSSVQNLVTPNHLTTWSNISKSRR